MKILDHYGTTIEFTAAEGPHASYLSITENAEEKVTATAVVRPDDAMALGHTLVEWARERMEKDGLF